MAHSWHKTGETHPGTTTVTLQRDNSVVVIRDVEHIGSGLTFDSLVITFYLVPNEL